MLRIGLTGELGSGKSTVAAMFAERGAIVLSSDEMGRALMQPGQSVFHQIVEHFGPQVLAADGTLNRRKLAALAFDPQHPRVAELNAIVHPAVLAAQSLHIAEIAQTNPDAIVVIESALIFSVPGWQSRFDRIVLVTAPEEQKVARFVARAAAGRSLSQGERDEFESDARRRLKLQQTDPNDAKRRIVLRNDNNIEQLEKQVQAAWQSLTAGNKSLET